MNVLLLGGTGQLGRTLCSLPLPSGVQLTCLSRADLEVTDTNSVHTAVHRVRPDVVINATAWTAVDAAETARAEAFAVNATAVENLAGACRDEKAYLIHISTDFVFGGDSAVPYRPDDPTCPAGVYGASKLAGEQAVTQVLREDSCIIRTSWLYSPYGNNFVKTMLRLMQERDQLKVVTDQVGTPTSAATLADCIWRAVMHRPTGIFHWSDAGVASWYDFAVAIQEEALAIGLLHRPIAVHPIPSSQYPTPARRPAFSVLDKSRAVAELGCPQLHWREALRQVLRGLPGLER